MVGKGRIASKTLSTASNLSNLLPTGTVLSLEAMLPTLTNNGRCLIAHRYLVGIVIGFNAFICFFSAFTDSVTDDGKVYYGVATLKGLLVFGENRLIRDKPEEHPSKRIRFIDFIHAFTALFVFLCFAFSDSNVQSCYFSPESDNENAIITNLPLVASLFATFLFTCFPTNRKGIGFSEPHEPADHPHEPVEYPSDMEVGKSHAPPVQAP